MLKNIMTQSLNLKSIYQHCYGRCKNTIKQYASCVLVDVDDTLLVSFLVIWQSEDMWHKEQGLGLMQVELEALIVE